MTLVFDANLSYRPVVYSAEMLQANPNWLMNVLTEELSKLREILKRGTVWSIGDKAKWKSEI